MMKTGKKSKFPKKRVLIALSGGIDSAVSAYKLIQQGYIVEAAFMKNWSTTNGLKYDECPWLIDRQDALRVAAFLGIPMHTLNFEKEYEKNVMGYFFKEYSAGRTPNPDVMCNKEIKFKMLYNWAMKHGFDYMATGHYAQVAPVKPSKASSKVRAGSVAQLKSDKKAASGTTQKNNNKTGETFNLIRSSDDFKDQTYFIYNISQSQLPHLLFPIGSMKKSAVKALAKKIKLPNATKKESMGLCFVGQIRLKDFLEQKLKPKRGAIVKINAQGKEEKIGEHEGLSYYTVGQRQGIRVGQNGPWFVVRKDLAHNRLVVTNNPNDPALETKQIEIHSVNWITEPAELNKAKAEPVKLLGRYRHQGSLEKLTVTKIVDKRGMRGHYKIEFAKPQKAIASGQSLVLYDGKICVGGGVIV